MKTFEKVPEKGSKQDKMEEIVLRASDLPEFQAAIKNARGKVEAITEIRVLLKKYFPEIFELPENKTGLIVTREATGLRPELKSTASNEFYIAREIVNLLWHNN